MEEEFPLISGGKLYVDKIVQLDEIDKIFGKE